MINKYKRLEYLSIDLSNIEDNYDVIDLTKISDQNNYIKNFLKNHSKGRIKIPKNQFVIKINDISDTNFLCVLVRKIPKSGGLYQIDIYYKNLIPYVENLPIATIIINNMCSCYDSIYFESEYFDYNLCFDVNDEDKIKFKNSMETNKIFIEITAFVLSTCYMLSTVKAKEYYGSFPKNEIYDKKYIITTTKSKFCYTKIQEI